MKYAFMSFSTPELGFDETLQLAKHLGYSGIEPRVDRNHAHGIELECTTNERHSLANRANEAGIEICCLATSIRYSDARKSKETEEETRRYIDLASAVGCSRLRVFGGTLPEGISREAGIESIASSFAGLATEAAAANVILCLETHDAWTNPNDVAEIMRRVNHPNVAVNWDVMHPQRTSGVPVADAFETLKPWIAHTHIHDGLLSDPLVMKPCGEGEIDLRTFFSSLHGAGYSGFISGEWIDCDSVIDLGDEIARMKALANATRLLSTFNHETSETV